MELHYHHSCINPLAAVLVLFNQKTFNVTWTLDLSLFISQPISLHCQLSKVLETERNRMAYVVIYFHQDFCFFVQESVWQEWPSLVHPLLHCHWCAAYWWGFLAWKICFLSHCRSEKAQSHGEEQNFEALSQFGGVKALGMILGTNIKGVTSGNVVESYSLKECFWCQ